MAYSHSNCAVLLVSRGPQYGVKKHGHSCSTYAQLLVYAAQLHSLLVFTLKFMSWLLT